MQKTSHLPQADRLSFLAATILLAYAVARFIAIPAREVAVQLPGIYLSVTVNVRTIVAFLVVGLTATGATMLFQDRPRISVKTPWNIGCCQP